jgi:tRNA(Ile)-lysidine synthetase, N-terminal domain
VAISNKNFSSFLNSIICKNNKLLIGISGGIDSMVLLDLCSKNFPKNHLHGIHVNHNLSPQAYNYESFVKNKFIEKNIPLIVKSEIRNNIKGESMEMWGRRIRYENYFQILYDLKFDYVVTAHHANDNIETILMNIQHRMLY